MEAKLSKAAELIADGMSDTPSYYDFPQEQGQFLGRQLGEGDIGGGADYDTWSTNWQGTWRYLDVICLPGNRGVEVQVHCLLPRE